MAGQSTYHCNRCGKASYSHGGRPVCCHCKRPFVMPKVAMNSISETALIRQWWYVYLWTLKAGHNDVAHLNEITKECEARGIVKEGRPMTTKGAEDLVAQVDEWKRLHAIARGVQP